MAKEKMNVPAQAEEARLPFLYLFVLLGTLSGLNDAPGLFWFYQASRLRADLNPREDANDFNWASVFQRTGLFQGMLEALLYVSTSPPCFCFCIQQVPCEGKQLQRRLFSFSFSLLLDLSPGNSPCLGSSPLSSKEVFHILRFVCIILRRLALNQLYHQKWKLLYPDFNCQCHYSSSPSS